MIPSTRKARAYAPEPPVPGRLCDAPDCAEPGAYRAPKGRREGSKDFHWFCLDHVRAFNAGWDYFKGMSAEQIEAELRADSSWQRPTWPLGKLGHAARMDAVLEDQFHVFAFGKTMPKGPPQPAAPPELREPLEIFGLGWPVTMDEVKVRYKELAKRYHPDVTGGDKRAEDKLKVINLAYATLRGKLAAPAHAG